MCCFALTCLRKSAFEYIPITAVSSFCTFILFYFLISPQLALFVYSTVYSYRTILQTLEYQYLLLPRRKWVPFRVRFVSRLFLFSRSFLAPVNSALFVRDLSLYTNFCKAALLQCLLLEALYKQKFIELTTIMLV